MMQISIVIAVPSPSSPKCPLSSEGILVCSCILNYSEWADYNTTNRRYKYYFRYLLCNNFLDPNIGFEASRNIIVNIYHCSKGVGFNFSSN